MKRIVWAAVAVSAALLAGCNSPHLALVQDNAVSVPIGTSYGFQAQAQDSTGTILWALSGPGSISTTSGAETVYTAPSTYDPNAKTAKLVASLSDAADQKQTVTITITKPTSTTGGIAGLNASVTVSYDERGIPTLNCTKSVDCYAVLGFIHARDRLFQMDFFRRAARGHLSELVGDAALSQDQALRTFFTTRDGQAMPEALYAHWLTDTAMAPRFAAYTAGVNAFIAQVRADPTKLPAAYKQLLYVIDPTKHRRPPGLERRGHGGGGAALPVPALGDRGAGGRLREVGADLVDDLRREHGGPRPQHRPVDPGQVADRGLHPRRQRRPQRAEPGGGLAADARVAARRGRGPGRGVEDARGDPRAAGADGLASRVQQLGGRRGPHRPREGLRGQRPAPLAQLPLELPPRAPHRERGLAERHGRQLPRGAGDAHRAAARTWGGA